MLIFNCARWRSAHLIPTFFKGQLYTVSISRCPKMFKAKEKESVPNVCVKLSSTFTFEFEKDHKFFPGGPIAKKTF